MSSLRTSPRFASLLGVGAAAMLGAPPTAAQVPQPAPFYVDGREFTSVPVDQALSGDYFDTSKFNVSTLGLGALFDRLGEQIHYQLDAGVHPSVFSPLCGLSGQMILRGGGCRMDFGWYCVDDPTTFVPLVTSQEVIAYHDALTGNWAQYKNDDASFVPIIGMPPVQGAPLEDVQAHPVFQNCPSKNIGFTIRPVGGAAGDIPSVQQPVCTQQKYSEPRLNTIHQASGQPWVSALVYASKRSPGVFYIAFEDLPSNATTFNPPVDVGDDNWVADGDFNDFVYRVQGIQCKGGGQRCDTGQLGICSIGITECTVDDRPGACVQKFQPTAESCDNIDNDCDGVIDNGDGLCPEIAPICWEGQCVARCSTGEFVCPIGYSCDNTSNACIEESCYGVECGEGQHCRAGVCIGGCDGVSCPAGQDCLFGNCVDLCQGISCPAGFVCQAGACIADCNCMPCPEGFDCGADGKCVDTACIGVSCPAGQVCNAGTCVDPCAGVSCPGGQICTVNPVTFVGECVVVQGGEGVGGGGSIEGTGGEIIVGVTGSAPGLDGTGSTGSARLAAPESNMGCACRAAPSGGSGGLVGLLLLGLGPLARRRAGRRR